ncbi:MAG: hypothetical protein HYU36_09210 [Planctomycetes bacterium]|nr:hypothetical protein [Planctomycetota bacterium]
MLVDLSRWLVSFAASGLLLFPASAWSEDSVNQTVLKRIEELDQEVKALRRKLDEQQKTIEEQQRQLESVGIIQPKPSFPQPGRPGEQELLEKSPRLGGIYSKPFLLQAGRKVFVGGYADLEFFNRSGQDSFFDQHRLIPFIYGDITENLKFATEIEFEHAGTDSNQGDGEIKVEFAHLDYLLTDWINFRAGILLTPLGKFNLVHDSPLNDLTDRPLVDQFIFPTTLSEAGLGFHGEAYPTENSKLNYEIYVVNGFDANDSRDPDKVNNAFDTKKGIRNARGSEKSDNNNNKAVAGRVAFSPLLGAELGGSFHVGTWDDQSDEWLSVYGLDAMFQKGPFELLGEVGRADIELPANIETFNRTAAADDVIPDDLFGYYVQFNYHFMFEALQAWSGRIFREESTFTLVFRWDDVDLDGPKGKRDRLTLGLNFRPVEGTVFKLDYQVNDGDRASDEADAFIFSVATYF